MPGPRTTWTRPWALGTCLCLILILASCAARFQADSLAENHGFQAHLFPGENFDLKWSLRGSGPVLRAYIEGDGKAWLNSRRPSSDPTPDHPAALNLAVRDTAPAVAWLARPCQFTEDPEPRNCIPPFWTSARFSEPVIHDLNAALDTAMQAAGADRLELVGYSGGGAVALLVAARRNDVDRVVTVAGNLDHAFWTGLHKVSPLRDSLNPADLADRLQSIPQTHIVSVDDDIVPPAVAQSYVHRMADPSRVRIVTVCGVAHEGDWWPALSAVLEARP